MEEVLQLEEDVKLLEEMYPQGKNAKTTWALTVLGYLAKLALIVLGYLAKLVLRILDGSTPMLNVGGIRYLVICCLPIFFSPLLSLIFLKNCNFYPYVRDH
ncbi:hypothetical protein VNO78_25685 [Psophocarpus tetragonolobus]|uniref:Uncharacterized protein n=1 Tax=Psophocarpus tetragonolobus TaxID=3891 RepID=A0AAN9S7U5_PSOTE